MWLQVVCVEPSPAAYTQLVSARSHFLSSVSGIQWCVCLLLSFVVVPIFLPQRSHVFILLTCPCRHLVQAGVSSSSGYAAFTRCTQGGGACGLDLLSGMGTTNDSRALPPSDIDLVHVVTVDELLAMHQLQHVDLLKVGVLLLRAPAMLLLMLGARGSSTEAQHFLPLFSPALLPSLVQIDAAGLSRGQKRGIQLSGQALLVPAHLCCFHVDANWLLPVHVQVPRCQQ